MVNFQINQPAGSAFSEYRRLNKRNMQLAKSVGEALRSLRGNGVREGLKSS